MSEPAVHRTTDFYCTEALSGHTPVVKVVETADVLAFRHTRPMWSTHIIVVPKRHVASLLDETITDMELAAVLRVVRDVASEVVRATGACGVQTNLGRYQDSQRLHWHVFSGERLAPA